MNATITPRKERPLRFIIICIVLYGSSAAFAGASALAAFGVIEYKSPFMILAYALGWMGAMLDAVSSKSE